jgi:hypothetical protein
MLFRRLALLGTVRQTTTNGQHQSACLAVQHGEVVMPSFTAVLRRIASMWHSPKREDLKAKVSRSCGEVLL